MRNRWLGTGLLAVSVTLVACGEERADAPQEAAAGAQSTADPAALVGPGDDGEVDTEAFRRATGPRGFRFPEDHGPHPDYRHEWWYVTGNVEDDGGRHFGFQVTFFRFAAPPSEGERTSAWATRQLWMAHLAVTDTEAGAFHHEERFARGALGLAGAEAKPFRVWLEDWELTGKEGGFESLQAHLDGEDIGIALELVQEKPLVFQGEEGYSRKGPDPGDASYYYTAPRLRAEGRIRTPEGEHQVRGTAWLDREWGTSTLADDQVGWDWFAIQLEDGRELMFYHLRRADGSIDPRSKGGWVDAAGNHRTVDREAVELQVLEEWKAPDGLARYPSKWRLRYPEEGLDLLVEPVLADQELRGMFRYWEGAVRVRGSDHDGSVRGVGYAELTGYAEDEP